MSSGSVDRSDVRTRDSGKRTVTSRVLPVGSTKSHVDARKGRTQRLGDVAEILRSPIEPASSRSTYVSSDFWPDGQRPTSTHPGLHGPARARSASVATSDAISAGLLLVVEAAGLNPWRNLAELLSQRARSVPDAAHAPPSGSSRHHRCLRRPRRSPPPTVACVCETPGIARASAATSSSFFFV